MSGPEVATAAAAAEGRVPAVLSAPPAPALVLADVHRRWRDRDVLCGASLAVAPGTVAWLGGANGAGKTTLLRIAAGLLTPDAGSVALEGLDPYADRGAYQRRLGWLPAGDRGLYARLSVTQNVRVWSALAFVPRRERPAAVAHALDRFELGDLARRRVDRLSMGQRQRVRLAMTFLHEPSVALLDEPHTSLDDNALALLSAALDELVARGGAALWCSPAPEHGALRRDASHVLADGTIRALDP